MAPHNKMPNRLFLSNSYRFYENLETIFLSGKRTDHITDWASPDSITTAFLYSGTQLYEHIMIKLIVIMITIQKQPLFLLAFFVSNLKVYTI